MSAVRSKVYMAFYDPDYKFEDAAAWKELTLSDKNEEFDLAH